MPYTSDAQRRKFHAMENRGEISPRVVDEFDRASREKKLPEKKKPTKKMQPTRGDVHVPTADFDLGLGQKKQMQIAKDLLGDFVPATIVRQTPAKFLNPDGTPEKAPEEKKERHNLSNLKTLRKTAVLFFSALDRFLAEEAGEEIDGEDEIKVGTSVKITQPMDHHFGRTGTVEYISSFDGTMSVRFDDNARSYYTPGQVERDDFPVLDEIQKKDLTSQGRKRIAEHNFALPRERKYPIHDISHARNALARSAGKPEEKKVWDAVYAKYPSIHSETEKSVVDADSDDSMYPGINNQEGGLLKEDDSDENQDQRVDLQRLVEGIDWELENSTADEPAAKELALTQLEKDPDHYRKLQMKDDGTDNQLEKDTNQTEEDQFANEGYSIDLGSGPCRETGHVGFDLYPHDIGTIVHDLHLGIPLEDGSVRKARLVNSLHTMDELSQDPKPLLSEIHRVLMPGGQFTYQGPNEIYNQQNQDQWGNDYPGLVMVNHEDNCDGVDKEDRDAGKIYRQTFTRLAHPDPATANDAEPRIGVANEDMLPADALIAADALGYYYSDATSSGRGNRIHGYPSQGALVDRPAATTKEKTTAEQITESFVNSLGGRWFKTHKSVEDDSANATQEDMEVQEALNPPPVNPPRPKRRPQVAKISKMEKILRKGKIVPILKANPAKQVVYGVVLAPDEIDSQEDFMEPDEIEKTAHKYLSASRVIGAGHEKQIDATPVESFIAPQDLELSGQYGPQIVKKGSWILGVKIHDPDEWNKITKGEYTGFSVGGQGARQPM
jgi:SAM-dependent methyltransferase